MAAVSKALDNADTPPVKPHSRRHLITWLGSGLMLLIVLVWIILQPPEPSVEIPQPHTKTKALERVEIPTSLVAQMRRLAQEQEPISNPKPPIRTPEPQPKAKDPAHRFKTGGTPALNADAPQAQVTPASNTHLDGTIPSLSIDLAGHSSEQVACHYRLALAVQSFEAQVLLGIFVEDQLQPVSAADLAHYSDRGRSADGLENAFALKGRIATQSGRSFDDIGLLYLVPKEVDDDWVAWQRQVIAQAGYTFGEVEHVKARYAKNLALEAYALVLKQGRTIHLKGPL